MIYLCIFTSNVYLLIYTSSIYIFIHLWYLRISISLSVFQTYLFLYILCLGLKDTYRLSQKIFNLEYDFGTFNRSFLRVNKIHSIKTNICGKNSINLIKSTKELKRINRLAFLKKINLCSGIQCSLSRTNRANYIDRESQGLFRRFLYSCFWDSLYNEQDVTS